MQIVIRGSTRCRTTRQDLGQRDVAAAGGERDPGQMQLVEEDGAGDSSPSRNVGIE